MTELAKRRRALIAQGGESMTFKKLTEVAIEADSSQITIPMNASMQNSDVLWIVPKFTLTATDYLYVDMNNHRTSTAAAFGYTQTSTPGKMIIANTRSVTIDNSSVGNKQAGVYGFGNTAHYHHDGTGINSYIGMKPYNSSTKFNAGTVEVWGWA